MRASDLIRRLSEYEPYAEVFLEVAGKVHRVVAVEPDEDNADFAIVVGAG